MRLKDESCLNKTFVLTAMTEEGEDALDRVLNADYKEHEKVIMNIAKISSNPLTVTIKFTNAMKGLAAYPKVRNKFRPFTVGAVIEKIVKQLEAYGASITPENSDVDIGVKDE